ncbi:MAG: DUF5681 domain-containing protein [Pseudomonadota bacterium]
MANKKYDVGYRKPPKQHRFEKGRSGNPRGRPKKYKSHISVLEETMPMVIDGKKRDISKFEASFRTTTQSALEGRLAAIKRFMKLCGEAGLLTPQSGERRSGVMMAEYSDSMLAHIVMTSAIREHVDELNRKIRERNRSAPPEPKTDKDKIVSKVATQTHFVPQLNRTCSVIELVVLKLQQRALIDKDDASLAYFEKILTKATIALDTSSVGVLLVPPKVPPWMSPLTRTRVETGEQNIAPKPGEPGFDPEARENKII